MQKHPVLIVLAVVAVLVASSSVAPAAAGDEVKILKGHASGVRAVAFSPDGQTLASASVGDTIKLWDVKSGALRRTLYGNSGDVSVIAFSRDGRILATGGDNGDVTLWELGTGKACAAPSGGSAAIRGLAFAPNDAVLAAAGADRIVHLWNPQSGTVRPALQGHEGIVLAAAFSPDGKTLASGGEEGTVKIWNLASEREETSPALRQRAKHGAILSVEFSPDGRELAIATRNVVEVWDLRSVQRQIEFKKRPEGAFWWSAHYSRQSTLIAIGTGAKSVRAIRVSTKKISASTIAPDDRVIRVWDVKTGQPIARLAGHHHSVRAVALSPDGNLLASGGRDKTVRIWDLAKSPSSRDPLPASQVAASDVDQAQPALPLIDDARQAECLKQLQELTNPDVPDVLPATESSDAERPASNAAEPSAGGIDPTLSLLMEGASIFLDAWDRSGQSDSASTKDEKKTPRSDPSAPLVFSPIPSKAWTIQPGPATNPSRNNTSATTSAERSVSRWGVFQSPSVQTFTHASSTSGSGSSGSSAGASETFHYEGGHGGGSSGGDHSHGGDDHHKK